MRRDGPDYDRAVPLLVVRVGRYPIHAGTLGAVRTMGRVGVPAFSMVEDRYTPAAVSRRAAGRFVAPTTGTESTAQLVAVLAGIGRRMQPRTGRPAIVVSTDDESSILVAEHRCELAEWFVAPDVEPGLPRRLASKRGLFELCTEHGVATPASAFPTSLAELDECAASSPFPVVVKDLAAFTRLRAPAARGTIVVSSAGELHRRALDWPPGFSVIVQEYLPRECSEDWIFQGYFDAGSRPVVAFTGRKLRSWPPHAGPTTRAVAIANPEIARLSTGLCRDLSYRGIVDLDWRLDRRDGRYKLVDFNPRVGAQFRLFETDTGIDVVRALHLDLTGRPVPAGEQVDGRVFVDEHLDPAARFAYRHDTSVAPAPAVAITHRELAFFAPDDVLPFVAMAGRFAGPAVARAGRLAVGAVRDRARRAPR